MKGAMRTLLLAALTSSLALAGCARNALPPLTGPTSAVSTSQGMESQGEASPLQFQVKRYPDRRLWAIFEPRSNTSRRNIHQEEYAHSFPCATRASLKVPERHDKVPAGEELDVPKLVEALKAQGIQADGSTDVAAMAEVAAREAKPGDVLLVMSNGAFGGFIDKLLAALKARTGGV